MQHEACRAILSAAKTLRAFPLPEKARDLVLTIERNANEAAGEIEYLQTAASVYRPEELMPNIYDDCRFSMREREFVAALWRAKGSIVSRQSLMSQIYAKQDAQRDSRREDGVQPKILEAFLWRIRRKIKAARDHLESHGFPSVVETIFGVGYRLVRVNHLNAKHDGKYKTNPCAK